MAPARSTKRWAATSIVTHPCPDKKQRTDPVAQNCNVIKEVLQGAGLPPSAQEMFEAAIPHTLGVCQDRRHRYQESMVAAIGSVISGVESDLKNKIHEAETIVHDAEAAVEDAKKQVAAADAECKAAREAMALAKGVLADIALAFRAAKQGLITAQGISDASNKEFELMTNNEQVLNSVLKERLELVKTGTLAPDQAAQQAGELIRMIEGRLELDESLAAALPQALAAPASDRSSFITTVFLQFEEALVSSLEEIRTKLQAEELGKEQRAAAVASAEEALKAAIKRQIEAAAAFSVEREAHAAREAALTAAKKALNQARPNLRKVESNLAEAQIALDAFHRGPSAVFAELRDRTTPPQEPEEASGEASAQTKDDQNAAEPSGTAAPMSEEGAKPSGEADGADAAVA